MRLCNGCFVAGPVGLSFFIATMLLHDYTLFYATLVASIIAVPLLPIIRRLSKLAADILVKLIVVIPAACLLALMLTSERPLVSILLSAFLIYYVMSYLYSVVRIVTHARVCSRCPEKERYLLCSRVIDVTLRLIEAGFIEVLTSGKTKPSNSR